MQRIIKVFAIAAIFAIATQADLDAIVPENNSILPEANVEFKAPVNKPTRGSMESISKADGATMGPSVSPEDTQLSTASVTGGAFASGMGCEDATAHHPNGNCWGIMNWIKNSGLALVGKVSWANIYKEVGLTSDSPMVDFQKYVHEYEKKYGCPKPCSAGTSTPTAAKTTPAKTPAPAKKAPAKKTPAPAPAKKTAAKKKPVSPVPSTSPLQCVDRFSFRSPHNNKYGCETFEKGFKASDGYEYYNHCKADGANPHCSECGKCVDPESKKEVVHSSGLHSSGPMKCHVMYAMADNNLDGAVAADVEELISNKIAIQQPNFYPLIFIDRHYNSDHKDSFAISGLKAKNGKDASDYHSGVRYIEKDFVTNQMKVAEEFGELNSDDSKTMTDFLSWAFKRCKAKAADAKVLLTLGSHGSGWNGFGGDANKVLLQVDLAPNNKIKTAILDSMKAVGDPNFTQLDLLGFDACLMMSYSSMYVYNGLSKYFVASEAVEPGHGWDYTRIDYTKDVKDIATQFADSYTYGHSSKNVKTLAVIEPDPFDEFKKVMDALAVELKLWLEADPSTDPDWKKDSRKGLIQQAWAKTLGAIDSNGVGTPRKDLGIFLKTMSEVCAQSPSKCSLSAALSAASATYSEMFAKGHFAYGANGKALTSGLTGMYIFFPFDAPTGASYTNWMVGGDGFAAASGRPWNQFLSSLHEWLPKCVGRHSFTSPYNAQVGCTLFEKGVKASDGYEYYTYCKDDGADPHCSECGKCEDLEGTKTAPKKTASLPNCVGRHSFKSPYDGKSGCSAFSKGVKTAPWGGKHVYEYFNWCEDDKATPHCSECGKCAD